MSAQNYFPYESYPPKLTISCHFPCVVLTYFIPQYVLKPFVTSFVLSFLWITPTWCQPVTKPAFLIGASPYYGFVIRHSDGMGRLSTSHPFGTELYWHKLTTGTQAWHHLYRYPEVGVAMGIVNFRQHNLGQLIYTLTYIDKPLTRNPKSALHLKIGTGFGYATQTYDKESNFQNTALSSRINYGMRGELLWVQQLQRHWQLRGGLMLTHFSNGALKMPNSGVNIPAVHLGISYIPHPPQRIPLNKDSVRSNWPKGYSAFLSAAFTIKETYLPGGRKFPGIVVLAYINRRISAKSALHIGLDATCNTAIRYQLSKDTTIHSNQKPDFKQGAFIIGHELFISNRLSMINQLGIYMYRPYKTNEKPVYQRNGLKYRFSKNMYAGVTLKTHLGTADFMEWSLIRRLF
jgi:hypothetical protein